MTTNFTIKCGGLSISQSQRNRRDVPRMTGSFHRLTPKQFDALMEAFPVVRDVAYLTTDGGQNFRTAEIDFGGLTLTIFADVPAEDFIPID